MNSNLKKLNMGDKVSHLSIEHQSIEGRGGAQQHDEVLAIAILLGGYNAFGRKINVEEYHKIKERFDECIREIQKML